MLVENNIFYNLFTILEFRLTGALLSLSVSDGKSESISENSEFGSFF